MDEPVETQAPGGVRAHDSCFRKQFWFGNGLSEPCSMLFSMHTHTHATHHTPMASVTCLTSRQAEKCSGLVPSEDSPPAAGYADAAQPVRCFLGGTSHRHVQNRSAAQHSKPASPRVFLISPCPRPDAGAPAKMWSISSVLPSLSCHLIPSSV